MAERGELRSGARFARRNFAYYSSVAELLRHHQRLLEREPEVSSRLFRIASGGSRARLSDTSLVQTTIRFRWDYIQILPFLRNTFLSLFREYQPSRGAGFEVVTTFNAILTDSEGKTFSLFYGHDYRAGNDLGASAHLRFGDAVVIKTLEDVSLIPTQFDFESLISQHRHSFENSGVRVHQFVNIVYLVYRFLDTADTR